MASGAVPVKRMSGVAPTLPATWAVRPPGPVMAALTVVVPSKAAEPVAVTGELDTIMAGLACGEVSMLAWQELERSAFAFMAIPDDGVAPAMRALRAQGVEAGESAVAGLIAFLASDEAGFCTGGVYTADGGFSAV